MQFDRGNAERRVFYVKSTAWPLKCMLGDTEIDEMLGDRRKVGDSRPESAREASLPALLWRFQHLDFGPFRASKEPGQPFHDLPAFDPKGFAIMTENFEDETKVELTGKGAFARAVVDGLWPIYDKNPAPPRADIYSKSAIKQSAIRYEAANDLKQYEITAPDKALWNAFTEVEGGGVLKQTKVDGEPLRLFAIRDAAIYDAMTGEQRAAEYRKGTPQHGGTKKTTENLLADFLTRQTKENVRELYNRDNRETSGGNDSSPHGLRDGIAQAQPAAAHPF
jgi:hypothetical protein